MPRGVEPSSWGLALAFLRKPLNRRWRASMTALDLPVQRSVRRTQDRPGLPCATNEGMVTM